MLGRISLAEALELTILIARKEPRRHPKVPSAGSSDICGSAHRTFPDVGLVVSALAALPENEGGEAVRNSTRRRERTVPLSNRYEPYRLMRHERSPV